MQETIMSFGLSHDGEVLRKTVVVVLFNKESKEFVYCDRPDYGLCCLVSGGVEGEESYEQAAQREIIEETGYNKFKIIGKLGARIMTHYYMQKKNEYRVKEIESYLVIFDPTSKTTSALEDDEQFSIKEAKYDVLLELMRGYKNSDGTGLEDHIEILQRGKRLLEELWVL